ncbi:hypothetical protein CULT_2170005 [[Clostridium] ultunense Esp]|nr:hypothetical protein CULT_2170005 [[Clostridium] ultunense Esp]
MPYGKFYYSILIYVVIVFVFLLISFHIYMQVYYFKGFSITCNEDIGYT